MGSSWAWCWLKRGVGEKEGELTVAPELLAQGELAGRGVTGDALYAQQNLSRQVVEQDGGYFWVVQDNQPGLRADIALLLAAATEGGRHGDRWEERTLGWTLHISSRVSKRIYQSVVQSGRDFPYIRVGGGQ